MAGPDDGGVEVCDDCRALSRPWRRGRSVMLYDGGARRLIFGLKHGDRLDLAPSLAGWMAARAGPVIATDTVIVPVPVHWWRLMRRRYNQAAVLALALARQTGAEACVDALRRTRSTGTQDGRDVAGRFANVAERMAPTRRGRRHLAGRDVCMIDDVFTSGATLDACTRACQEAGAASVSVMALARVVRDV